MPQPSGPRRTRASPDGGDDGLGVPANPAESEGRAPAPGLAPTRERVPGAAGCVVSEPASCNCLPTVRPAEPASEVGPRRHLRTIGP